MTWALSSGGSRNVHYWLAYIYTEECVAQFVRVLRKVCELEALSQQAPPAQRPLTAHAARQRLRRSRRVGTQQFCM